MKIKIKLFMGLDTIAKIDNYNLANGITLEIKNGTRLRTLKKKLNLNGAGFVTAFKGGEKISSWTRLKEGDTISFFKPTGGG